MRPNILFLCAFASLFLCFDLASEAFSQSGNPGSEKGDGFLQPADAVASSPGEVDPRIEALKQQVAALRLKRDQLRQDSLTLETRAFERRREVTGEGRRIDSLLLITAAVMKAVAAKQVKVHESAANSPEQAKLDDVEKQRLRLDEQIAMVKTEILALTAEGERIRTASGFAEKKVDQGRSPLAAALANMQALLTEKIKEQEALKSIDEMIRLDSAIIVAKNNLNSAIEKNAMHKRGAGKLVEQYENDVSTFMGQFDDAKRKNPRAALAMAKLSTAASTKDKRAFAAKFMASVTAEIASLTTRRDQAQRNLSDFDRAHPSPAKSWNRRLHDLDSMAAAKRNFLGELATRRGSFDKQIAMLQNMVQGFGAATHAKVRKVDSAAAFSKSQWSDLTVRRGQVRGDSSKNESTLSLGLMRLRVEQAKVSAQISALTRAITSAHGELERRKQSVSDEQGSEEQIKAANQLDAMKRTERDAGAPTAFSNVETAQKIMEDIYTLLDSGAIDKAIGQFTAKRSFLLASTNFEAFKVLQYAVDKAVMSRKNHARRK